MNHDRVPDASLVTARPLVQVRIWQLWLLALFVAIAIVNIRDQGRSEPALIALAAAGFALYGFLAWAAWCVARRLRARMGTLPVLVLYLVALTGLFLVATVVYLLLEHGYLAGMFGRLRLF